MHADARAARSAVHAPGQGRAARCPADREEVRRTLALLVEPGSVVELRIPKTARAGTVSGYFADLEKLTAAAAEWSGRAPGIYVTLNPVNADLLARAANHVRERAEDTTSDQHIGVRRWLPFDLDAVRVGGISSTDDEHAAALERSRQVVAWLIARGVEPASIVLADSGNGGHVLVRIDLPNCDQARQLVERCLAAAAFALDDEGLKVDQKVANAARIWKLYGTLAAKGDDMANRPHRLARLLDVPETIVPTRREVLEAIAAQAPAEPPRMAAGREPRTGTFDLTAWVAAHALPVMRCGPWKDGTRWILNPCPFNSEHTNAAAYIVQMGHGAIAAGCHHSSCTWGWAELREHYDPEDESPPGASVDPAIPTSDAMRGAGGASHAARLVELTAGAELFHSLDMEAFATIVVDDHAETWPLRSRNFRLWLQREFHRTTRSIPSTQATQDALGILTGRALFEGETRAVFVRVAGGPDDIYLDLGDASWTAVHVTAAGWELVRNPPVKFRRARGMLPLPMPVPGGSLDALARYANVWDETSWRLLVAWLIAACRPRGPYPVLMIHGDAGAAKSTLARLLRALIDPSSVPLRAEPRDVRDVMITATNAWVIAYDNLDHLRPWLSNALCRLATGGGFSTRELYTDAEEVLFEATRPVIINGIEELATRSDLLDRGLLLDLREIPDERRQPEEGFWAAFEDERPRLLGALLDAVSTALRTLPSVRLARLPRLADFAIWTTAAEGGLGWAPGSFLRVYDGNRGAAHDITLDASPVAGVVRELLEQHSTWCGTATNLLSTLATLAGESVTKQRDWPRNGKGLAGVLRRLASTLRAVGIGVDFEREPGGQRRRLIRLEKMMGPYRPDRPETDESVGPVRDARRDANGTHGDADRDGGAGERTGHPSPESRGGTHRDGRDAEEPHSSSPYDVEVFE